MFGVVPPTSVSRLPRLAATWHGLVCSVCMLVLAVPAVGFSPLNLLMLWQVQTEEETRSEYEAKTVVREERRGSPAPPKLPKLRKGRRPAFCSPLRPQAIADHSEYRSLNGIGTPLRC